MGEPTEHPTRDQLVAYCRGELSPQESEAVAAHLAWCRDDADFVLAFREVSGLDPADEEPAEELDAAWSDFVGRKGSAVAAPPASLPDARVRSTGRRFRMPLALAASLLVAAVSTAGWIASLVRSDRPPMALANGQIVDLGATDEERAAGPDAREIVLGADEASLTLILHPTRELTAGSYSAALLARDGEKVWQGDVRPTELDTFHVTFPRESLPAGESVLELRRQANGRFEVIDRFPLRIVLH
ncbi:MAG TPA: zf-HC2 domain-containing protein [Thermoanaerobaculia bacterium]|nr:zf-HC2 domain-containing protein [Thermoanaerobaculia bacterium]